MEDGRSVSKRLEGVHMLRSRVVGRIRKIGGRRGITRGIDLSLLIIDQDVSGINGLS